MTVEGPDRVGGGDGLAVVELHALAHLENPAFGVFAAFPAVGQFGDRLLVRVKLDQRVSEREADSIHIIGKIGGRVERVAGSAFGLSDPECATPFWGLGVGEGCTKRPGGQNTSAQHAQCAAPGEQRGLEAITVYSHVLYSSLPL